VKIFINNKKQEKKGFNSLQNKAGILLAVKILDFDEIDHRKKGEAGFCVVHFCG